MPIRYVRGRNLTPLARRKLAEPMTHFIIPEPEPGDNRPRNAFGVLKGFGIAYAAHYATEDAKALIDRLANDARYRLALSSAEPQRFDGDDVCGSITFLVTCDGVKVATIHYSKTYFRDRFTFTVNLSPIRFSGPRTDDHFDHNWHDAGPFDSIEKAFGVAIERCEYIRAWRARAA